MTDIGSWKFWVIVALALGTLACAGRRERREDAREERRERAEQRRAERAERNEQRRTGREARQPDEAKATTQPLTPVSTAPAAAAAESKVVFMRASSFGAKVAASIFDVTESGAAKFVGIVRPWNKIVYPVKPGLYTFMVVTETADFMQATVIGGKTYYALVTPQKSSLSFKPVRAGDLDGSQFTSWERNTKLVTNTPTTLAWARDNAASVADKRDRHWPEWSSKGQSEKDAQTLRAEDGR